MKMKLFLAAFAILFGTASIFAQEVKKDYKPYPYGFVGLQGGAQMTFTNYKHTKLITPLAGVQVGAMFTPVVGARLSAQGIWNKTAAKAMYEPNNKCKYKYVTGDLDLLVNLSNAFFPGKTHTFNTFLIAGAGLTYAWDYEPDANMPAGAASEFVWTGKRYSHNFRVGLAEEINLAKHWAVNIEVDLNNLHDRFNCKRNWDCDWQLTGMVGITYKFGFKKAPKPVVAPPVAAPVETYVEPKKVEEPPVVKEEKPAPAPVKKFVPLKETIHYAIRESDPVDAILDKVAAWHKENPGKTIHVSGYADKGTGNETVNKKYSQARVDKVVEGLKARGVAAGQIKATSYGDSVQPFPADNEKNRCVVVESK